MKATDTQIGGNHYKQFKVQPIEFCMKNGLNACQTNIVKYICRYKHKNGKEDLLKALHYVELLMEFRHEGLGTNYSNNTMSVAAFYKANSLSLEQYNILECALHGDLFSAVTQISVLIKTEYPDAD